MKYLAVLVVAFSLLFAAPAAGSTTLHYPDRALQAKIDHSFVPTPDVLLHVNYAWCPGTVYTSCMFPSVPDTMWLVYYSAFDHELGHAFDYWEMTDAARIQFGLIIHDTRPWRVDEAGSPHEKFAVAYSQCMEFQKQPLWEGKPQTRFDYNLKMGPIAFRRVCTLIRNVYMSHYVAA